MYCPPTVKGILRPGHMVPPFLAMLHATRLLGVLHNAVCFACYRSNLIAGKFCFSIFLFCANI